MGYRIEIESDRGLVVTVYEGVVTSGDLALVLESYARHPDFRPEYAALVDLTRVERADFDVARVLQVGEASPYAAGSRLAVVAPGDVSYGLARAFQMTVEERGREARVFRSRTEAEAWLGIAGGGP